MLTPEQVNNIIKKCKYNNDNIQRDMYPSYLSANLEFIDQDIICQELQTLSNINTKSPYLVETLDNNGIGKVNNNIFDILIILLVIIIIFIIRTKLI
jgi:hypothetical protein